MKKLILLILLLAMAAANATAARMYPAGGRVVDVKRFQLFTDRVFIIE